MDSKSETHQPSTTLANITTNIIDINEDCLLKILEHLNLDDLTSVVTTNKLFNKLARSIYPKKYSQYRIELSRTCISAWDDYRNVTCRQQHYKHRPDVQAFLYYFGDSIKKLSIQFDDFITPELIERNLLKCCRDSLTELKLIGMEKSVFNAIEITFPNVERLSFYSCRLPFEVANGPSFLRWFPAVNHLELIRNYTDPLIPPPGDGTQSIVSIINKHFTKLEHLKIIGDPYSYFFDMIKELFVAQKHLKSFSFGITRLFNYRFNIGLIDIFRLVRQYQPNLESLELYNINGPFMFATHKRLKLKHLLIDGSRDAPGIESQTLSHLESLEIRTRRLSYDWINFILNLITVKRLTIRIFVARQWVALDDEEFLAFSNLPNLEEMSFAEPGCLISLKAVQSFISVCKTLKRLTMIYYSYNRKRQTEFLEADFGPEWRVSVECLAIVIEKCTTLVD